MKITLDWQACAAILPSSMETLPSRRSERFGDILTIVETDRRGRATRTVFVNYGPVIRFDIDKPAERRVAAVQLVEVGHCNQIVAGEICGFHRNTVSELVKRKELLGLESIVVDHRGRKGPYKYVDEVRNQIEKILKEHTDWSDQAVADQASEDLSIAVSRSSVARIRTGEISPAALRVPFTLDEIMKLAEAVDAIDKQRFRPRQLELNFEADPGFQEKVEEFAEEAAPKGECERDDTLIERLGHGEDNVVCGGLMHQLFWGEFGVEKLVRGVFSEQAGATYQAEEILGTLYHSVLLGVRSVEALKLVNGSELGLLIGQSRSPDKETIRERLGEMAEQGRSANLIDDVAARLLELARIDREVFFIDGHFLPYYGLSVMAKGYHTVRRLAMRGNEIYVVSDLRGRPLWFVTETCEIDFRPILSQCADKLIELGIKRPLMVFDRGGYGIHFFSELSEKADFITWSKYVAESTLRALPTEAFRMGIEANGSRYLVAQERRSVREALSTARKEGRESPTEMELRLVVIEDVETSDRVGIYTNDTTRCAGDIAYYMLQRWGKSENLYKELMDRFYLNYHPGYDIDVLEKQPLVENPDVLLCKRGLKTLQGEIPGFMDALELTEARIEKCSDERAKKKLIKKSGELLAAIDQNQTDIAALTKKLEGMPEKISILDLLKGKPMSRCELEKKRLFDVMQFLAYHSRERLVEVFADCYDDPRDIKPVLDMITKKSGYVKLFGKTLVVLLDWIDNRKHREADQELCRRLNEKAVCLAGGLGLRLYFHASSVPRWTQRLPTHTCPVSPEQKPDSL